MITILNGHTVSIDDEDLDIWNAHMWRIATQKNNKFRLVNNRLEYFHRLVMIKRGFDCGLMVDHIDGNPLNNTRANLRMVTNSQNGMNKGLQKNNTVGYKGVVKRETLKYSTNPYKARIKIDGKIIYLGVFPTSEDAARAYNEAAIRYHGEYAKLNIIP